MELFIIRMYSAVPGLNRPWPYMLSVLGSYVSFANFFSGEMMMLANAPVTTILPVRDMERARDFYENKLGLKPGGMKPDGKFVYTCAGGAVIALFHTETGTNADHTAISFQVSDIDETIKLLNAVGVAFGD